jgi:hypothetical protein
MPTSGMIKPNKPQGVLMLLQCTHLKLRLCPMFRIGCGFVSWRNIEAIDLHLLDAPYAKVHHEIIDFRSLW